jgi:hypothetical protein
MSFDHGHTARMASKLIFLDFDGVLHPISAGEDGQFCRAALLASTLAGFEGNVQVVVSSDKRGYYTLDELKAMLPAELAQHVIGVTPFRAGNRLEEIQAFVAKHAPAADWRALDDDFLSFPKGFQQLIRCDGFVGFDDECATALRTWLTE